MARVVDGWFGNVAVTALAKRELGPARRLCR